MTTNLKEIQNIREQVLSLTKDTPSINWSWLAGFHQAEGYFSMDKNGLIWGLSQKNPEILLQVKNFISVGSLYSSPNEITITPDGKTHIPNTHQLKTFIFKDTLYLLELLTPYLWSNKKEQANKLMKACKLDPIERQEAITWDFITGFWEGDGYLHRAITSINVCFTQKDTEILETIKQFIGSGSIAKHKDAQELRIGDGSCSNRQTVKILLDHARVEERRAQLAIATLI